MINQHPPRVLSEEACLGGADINNVEALLQPHNSADTGECQCEGRDLVRGSKVMGKAGGAPLQEGGGHSSYPRLHLPPWLLP